MLDLNKMLQSTEWLHSFKIYIYSRTSESVLPQNVILNKLIENNESQSLNHSASL